MYKDKKFLAIIPAREGSKGLPGKNIKLLCGKPLIAWSIEAGLESRHIDELVVTTDSLEIAKIASDYGASTPFIRPKEYATDTSTSWDVVNHAIEFYASELNVHFDYIVLLEPTSPLRESGDIDQMIESVISLENEFDAIISLGQVHEHPMIMKKISDKKINSYIEHGSAPKRRQDYEAAYFPYGVAYIIKTSTFLSEKTFYPRRTTYYVIDRYQCYEIDDIYDFLAVENIMMHKGSLK